MSGTNYPATQSTSQRTGILDYVLAETSEIGTVFTKFDFDEKPFGDSRFVIWEQADMTEIKLECLDIFLVNTPKTERDKYAYVSYTREKESMNWSLFIFSSYQRPHQVRNSIHCNATSFRNASTVLCIRKEKCLWTAGISGTYSSLTRCSWCK
jgi:hypothetical protein